MDEVYSPVQAVLDREILEYGRRLFTGVGDSCFDRTQDMVDIIREGVADSGYLMHDTTVGMFREFYGFNRLSEASNLSVWRGRGGKTLEAKAWEEAQRLIKAYDWQLEGQAARDVEKIYRKGVALLEQNN